jgi:hypothetical protein
MHTYACSLLMLLAMGCATQPPKQSARPLLTLSLRSQQAMVAAPASIASMPTHVNLGWNASLCDCATGYVVYYGLASRDYPNRIEVGNGLSITLTNGLVPGETNYFAVTAEDVWGQESNFSDELAYVVPQWLELHFPEPGTALESSTDLVNWSARPATLKSNAWFVIQSPDLPMEFYRQRSGD